MTDNPSSKLKWVALAAIWVGVVGVLALGWRFWVAPARQQAEENRAKEEHQQTIDKTSAQSRYTTSAVLATDGFSGYAPFRSTFFKEETAKFGLRVELKDDGGNYRQRLKDMNEGRLDMAVFTIDALIKTSAELGDFPGTIVSIVDESKGADAMLAAGKMFPNIDALNDPEVRFVCLADSPSETLARVVMSQFKLDRLPPNPFEYVDSAEAIYQQYQRGKPTDKKVFILWEPYASRIAENPDYHVLIDSSKFRGFIVDVVVARRGFLLKNEQVVEQTVKSQLTTVFAQRNGMVEMVMEDARMAGSPLKKDQAERLCKTIWWKNTQEQFGHFGVVPQHGLQHMEEMCRNITEVLVRTGAIKSDPTNGSPNRWYYDGIIRKLHDTNWHPGFGDESVRKEKSLVSLTDDEWGRLKPVGTLQVPRLVFARGTNGLTAASETTLSELAEKLKNWPQYYLIVRGHAASDGDLEANLKLATARATAAVEWLAAHGVDKGRIRAESSKPNGSTTVQFILGELPY